MGYCDFFKKTKKVYCLLFGLLFISAIPYYYSGSGLDEAEAIDLYLNHNFPSRVRYDLSYEPVFSNLTFDSPLTFNEDAASNRIIVGQRDGKIFWFDKEESVIQKNTLLDLSDEVGVVWDGGFLGLALHPEFGSQGKNYFYVYYTTEDANGEDYPDYHSGQWCTNDQYWGNYLILSRYDLNPETFEVDKSSEQVLLKRRMYGTTHRGGGLLFGADGFLYLSTGDQSAWVKAQDISNNVDGGVLRIDVDKDTLRSHPAIRKMPSHAGFQDEISGNDYWIPNDNPFLSPDGKNFEEYYSLGHRNPHRMTMDRETGVLYVGEIGGALHEEINVIEKGKNYGWPVYEGLVKNTSCVPQLLDSMPHTRPLTTFPRSEANSVIGGFVYRGNQIPDLYGKYICADYGIGEEIWSVNIENGNFTQLGNFASTDIISFGEDSEGEIYLLKQGISNLYKITSVNNPYNTIPDSLSKTGAFKDLETLEPTEGLIPYDLVESFWSDGAIKKRWMAVPNDGDYNSVNEKIVYSENDLWKFPVGSVLIKHFELPIDHNDPTKRKRLETRFSVKGEDNQFYFLTYKWNESQTDAVLLTEGLEESILVQKSDGSSDFQIWSYPDIGDCISCHNTVSDGTLGPRTRFLNKDYTYDKTGRTANQLVTFSHLGIIDQNIEDIDVPTLLTSKSIKDSTATIEEKARSYLDLNCAYCHRPGTGNRGEFDLRLTNNLIQTGILNAAPVESLGLPDEKILEPGNSGSSILYHRVQTTNKSLQMPPIGKNKIDEEAVRLLETWIQKLQDPCPKSIVMERYDNVEGTSIADLKNHPGFPDIPSDTLSLYEFDIPVDSGDDYGVRVRGLLRAPETGTYRFWVSGDNGVELILGTGPDASGAERIAYHDDWSRYREWGRYATQRSLPVELEAGGLYYMEALMNEGNGGDHLTVGWRRPSDGDGEGPSEVLHCAYFAELPSVAVTGVSVSPSLANLTVGSALSLSASVAPSDATDPGVSWSSSDEGVATVGPDGLVTGVSVGVATVTATTSDGGHTASAEVTVDDCVGRIVMERYEGVSGWSVSGLRSHPSFPGSPSFSADLDEFDIPVDSGDDYGVRVRGLLRAPETGTYRFWVSGDNGVELILGTGPDASGAERIAYHDDWSRYREWGRYATQRSLPVELEAGGLYYMEALMNEGNGGDHLTVGWRRPSDGDGEGPSEVLHCAYFAELPSVAVTGVSVSPSLANLTVGSALSLSASVAPSDATDPGVSWSSSDEGVATVGPDGLVTGVSVGVATVTATTSDGGHTASAEVTVEDSQIRVSGILISPDRYELVEGESLQMITTLTPTNPTNDKVIWSSSDSLVVNVDSLGMATALLPGQAVVTATTDDGGYTSSSEIIVADSIIPVSGIYLNPDTAELIVGNTLQVLATIAPNNATNDKVHWSSRDSLVASVDTLGLVTAHSPGNVNITGTSDDGGYTYSSLISVYEVVTTNTNKSISTSKKKDTNILNPVNDEFKIFPNPASDFITIVIPENTKECVLGIYDESNRLVIRQIGSNNEFKIDVSGLSKGVYIIVLSDLENNTLYGKFLKE
ncbi:Ig-like domain-containing protein [Euzebyella marina]|uniref:Ig-like domain-containing protein n=1 Tax=Euzebyella marina TaxID=1761453 RepID=UPI0017862503|nr:Ig-like domain-containing protein [Euzebyella marina]